MNRIAGYLSSQSNGTRDKAELLMYDHILTSPELLLSAYAQGFFPMADSATSEEVHWYTAKRRGVIILEKAHIPHSLLKFERRGLYKISTNRCCDEVIRCCAGESGEQVGGLRNQTWINKKIHKAYMRLHEMGYCHSVEAFEGDILVGGLYGVTLGSIFFGESMFSRKTNASKVCLTWLIHNLGKAGYAMIDTQFHTDHLQQFGCEEVTQDNYFTLLKKWVVKSPSGDPFNDG